MNYRVGSDTNEDEHIIERAEPNASILSNNDLTNYGSTAVCKYLLPLVVHLKLTLKIYFSG